MLTALSGLPNCAWTEEALMKWLVKKQRSPSYFFYCQIQVWSLLMQMPSILFAMPWEVNQLFGKTSFLVRSKHTQNHKWALVLFSFKYMVWQTAAEKQDTCVYMTRVQLLIDLNLYLKMTSSEGRGEDYPEPIFFTFFYVGKEISFLMFLSLATSFFFFF